MPCLSRHRERPPARRASETVRRIRAGGRAGPRRAWRRPIAPRSHPRSDARQLGLPVLRKGGTLSPRTRDGARTGSERHRDSKSFRFAPGANAGPLGPAKTPRSSAADPLRTRTISRPVQCVASVSTQSSSTASGNGAGRPRDDRTTSPPSAACSVTSIRFPRLAMGKPVSASIRWAAASSRPRSTSRRASLRSERTGGPVMARRG